MEKNYYQLIGLKSDADATQISEAIRTTRKRYRSLVGSPNPRQRLTAELALLDLDEAEQHLLDDELRRVYDKSIAVAVKQNMPEPKRKIVRHNYKLIRLANDALESRNYWQAFDLAVSYMTKYGETYDAWDIYYKSSLELKEYPQALNAINKMIIYKPFDLSLKSIKFDILYGLGFYSDALEFCEQLLSEGRNYDLKFNIWVETCIAHLLCRLGRRQEAMLKYGDLFDRFPNEELVKHKYDEDTQYYRLDKEIFKHGSMEASGDRGLVDLNTSPQYYQKSHSVGVDLLQLTNSSIKYIKFKNYLWWVGVFVVTALLFGKYFMAMVLTVVLVALSLVYINLR